MWKAKVLFEGGSEVLDGSSGLSVTKGNGEAGPF